jgi:hypothetical protein
MAGMCEASEAGIIDAAAKSIARQRDAALATMPAPIHFPVAAP